MSDVFKIINATKEEACRAAEADAIRAKTGETESLSYDFANGKGFAEAIESISSGGGITPTGSITLTEEKSYDVTEKATAIVDMSATRARLAEAITAKGVATLPDSSFDAMISNVGLISGGGGSLPSVISKIDGGSFTVSSDTASGSYSISHNLGETPKGFLIWSEDIQYEAYSVRVTVKIAYSEGEKSEYLYWQANTNATARYGAQAGSADDLTSTTFKATISANYYKAGCTYKWLAWA